MTTHARSVATNAQTTTHAHRAAHPSKAKHTAPTSDTSSVAAAETRTIVTEEFAFLTLPPTDAHPPSPPAGFCSGGRGR